MNHSNEAAAGLLGLLAVGGAIMLAMLAFALLTYLVVAACCWRILTKAGKPGWPALIPVYNLWVMMEIVGLPGPLALAVFAPLVAGLIPFLHVILAPLCSLGLFGLGCYFNYRLARVFGKDMLFTVFLILPFTSIFCLIYLAAGSDAYLGVEAAN